mmetsp:Transcript_90514/g.251619  ORF Transcript_90514/g.251619 Transcript_90514/m.251619 type:complete len:537 (-) Transcript_90514:463-2073(-)
MVHMGPLFVGIDPLLAIICAGLFECKVNRLLIILAQPLECDLVVLYVLEVLFGLVCGAGAQAFVVLGLPALPIVGSVLPLLVLIHGEKALLLLTLIRALAFLPHLHNRRHKLLQEAVSLEEAGPPTLDQVDEQSLDVRPVVILICHQHDRAVSQATGVRVLSPAVKAHDLQQVHDLLVSRDLFVVSVAHIEHLAPKWEHTVAVAPHHRDTRHGHGLGRVTFREDKGAILRVLAASFIRILELGDATHAHHILLTPHLATKVDLLLGLGPVEDHLDHATLHDLFQEFFRQLAGGAELGCLCCQGFLRLRVEGGVLDEAVDEHKEVVLHVRRLDFHAATVLALDHLQDGLNNLLRNMHHVRTPLDRIYGVDKADLLEGAISEAHRDLPALAAILVDYGAVFLHVQVDVILEGLDGQLLPVEKDLALLVCRARNVVSPLHHETGNVIIEALHAKLRKVRPEGHTSILLATVVRDLRLVFCGHVVLKGLRKLFLGTLVSGLDGELLGEDVRQLGPVAVPASRHLLLIVVVVVAGEQVAEN